MKRRSGLLWVVAAVAGSGLACKPRSTGSKTLDDGQEQQVQAQEENPDNAKSPVFDQEVESYCQQQLQEFQQSTQSQNKDFMNKHVQKFDVGGKPVDDSKQFFQEGTHFAKGPVHQRQNQNFLELKNDVRQQNVVCLKQQGGGQDGEPCEKQAGVKAPIKANDNPALLVFNEEEMVTRVQDLDRYRSFRLPAEQQPWSDDYWAIYSGIIGKRYASGFPKSENWKENFDGTWTQPADRVFASGNAGAINKLSPAEKYDLVNGDNALGVTRSGWNEGKKYFDSSGKVETWMGICHGWAPAAYMLPRPANTVSVDAPGGKKVTFYPSDIKALGSYLWAKANYTSRFMGGRCNDKTPTTDSVGRVTSPDCFDNNPGAWHIAIINQMAISKRSFVMDVTYDYEVWNQPVLGYAFKYFNPSTNQFTENLQAASTPLPWAQDPFRRYRTDARAKSVVGVAMEVWYMVETSPKQTPNDKPTNDAIRRVRYMYDLELDGNGKVIGGEWYQNEHPDFMWTPGPGASQRVAEHPMGKFVNKLFAQSAAGGGGGGGGGGDDGDDHPAPGLTFRDFLNSKFYGADGKNLWLNEGQTCTGRRASGVRRCRWSYQDNNSIKVTWDDNKVYWYRALSRNRICFAGEAAAAGECSGNMSRQ